MTNFPSIQCCVIIPTYNNEKTLKNIVERTIQVTSQKCIIVNDGSTDSTNEIIKEFNNQCIIISYKKNKGKGFAIKKGFEKALELGFEYAITLDSDGQHYPEDIPLFIDEISKFPHHVIMGSRNMNHTDVPGKSSFGNTFSNFWFYIETGIKLPDTQTGFRLYPLKKIESIKLYTYKFETEIELIVRLAWKNVPFKSIPIRVKYDANERVSHFRPFKDFTRISILNTVLVTLTFIYFLPKRLFKIETIKKFHHAFVGELFKTNESNLRKSISIAFGLFIGILPIWGFQLLIGIPLALLFRLNKVLFLTAAHISIPPFIPFILYFSYLIGEPFVSNPYVINDWSSISLDFIHNHFVQYIIGGILLSIGTSITGFLISFLLLSIFRKSN